MSPLAGVELPRWPQITPSESRQVSQRREETPTPSPRTPSQEASAAQGAWSDIPAPMETGGSGDGRSWVDRAEAIVDDEFRRDRPMKRGDGKAGQHSPSRSKIMLGDVHQYSSSTNMQESNHGPATMWLPRG